MQRPWKRCTELQSNAQSPQSVVQSSRAVHIALGTVYGAPGALHRAPEQCRALGAVDGAPGAMQSPWSSVRSPRTRHTAPEQCVEPQAPAGSSIWVNPCLAPGRQLENRSGSCLRNLCSLLELHRGTKAALCGVGHSPPAPGALQCRGAVAAAPSLPG